MLNIRRKGKAFVSKISLGEQLYDIGHNFNQHDMNLKVLMVLIKTKYCQTIVTGEYDKKVYL
jgi:hypothetical protein